MNESEQKTAVVVNDDSTQLKVLAAMAQKAGLTALSFTNAEDALASMSLNQPPDIIITDVHMPGIDGWKFCRLLKSPDYEPFNRVPILVVSSVFAGEAPDRIAAEIGADAFLSAPVDGHRFVRQVKAILRGDRKRQHLSVLIIEDSPTLAHLLQNAFVSDGYRADVAHSLQEVSDIYVEVPYDVAIIDYHLPDGFGDTLLERFQNERPDCACIMMTGDLEPELSVNWMKRGAAAYVHKPFNPEYLLELCAKARRERALLRAEDLLRLRTKELRSIERNFQSFYETIDDIVVVATLDARILYANPAAVSKLGYSLKEMASMNLLDWHPADCRAQAEQEFAAFSSEKPAIHHLPLATKDGKLIPTETRAWRGKWGETDCIFGICRDCSAEQEAQKRFEQLFHFNPSPMALLDNDPHRRFVEVNNAFLSATGYDLDDVIGKTTSQLHLLDDPKHQEILRNRLTAKECITNEELRIRCKDGHIIDGLFSGKAITVSGQPHILLVITDISDRKQANERLRASQEEQQHLIQNLHAGVVVHAADSRILLANDQATKLLGLSIEEMTGKVVLDPAWHFVHEDLSPMDIEEYPISRVLATQLPIQNMVMGSLHATTRTCIWVLVNAFPEFGANGEIRQVVVTFVDITELKKSRAAKEKLEKQLIQAQKMESIGRLAGGVAHDFNNMLSVILGHAELALKSIPLHQPLHEELEEIRSAAERSVDLTRQLLAFARKQNIVPKALNVNQTVEGMMKMLRRLIGEHIDLVFQPDPHPVSIRVDPSQFDQIMVNLCVNARDAIGDTGRILLKTSSCAFDETTCASHADAKPGSYVHLTVSDSGCGMDKPTMAQIFEPFFTTKGEAHGTGLGLATVYGIVKQNQGFIEVESEPGRGTTFHVYFPRLEDSPDPNAKPCVESTALKTHGTILLVEDEPAILRMGKSILERQGYTVFSAGTPTEALQLAAACPTPIHLLITDVLMPEMNGRDLAAKILASHPDLRILFMSGHTSDILAEDGALNRSIHFLQKPFTLRSLVTTTAEALASPSPE